MNKKLIWGIVIVIVLVAGIAYYNSSIAKPVCWPYCENMTDQDREKIKESVTADWKTYTNEKYDFSFKYPPEASISSIESTFASSLESYQVLVPDRFQVSLFVFKKDSKQNISEWYKNTFVGMYPNKGPIMKEINGYSVIEISLGGVNDSYKLAGPYSRHIMIAKDEFVVDFLLDIDSVDSLLNSEQELLINSFKFTN